MKLQRSSLTLIPDRQSGLTLLEVVIALIIVSVAISVFMTNSSTSLVGNERSRVYGGVATATIEALEAVKLMSLSEIQSLNGTQIAHSQGSGIKVTATARNVQASDVRDLGSLNSATLQHVTLATEFKSREGQKVVKPFATIVYKPR